MSAEVEKAVDGRPTREEYAKWVAFYFSAVDDEEARSAGCARDGHDMLRGLYEREVAALKEKQIDRIIECPSCGSRWNISRYNACACGAVLALKEKV
jgi:DNA-directed RNA polymerase subunit RPC12/RpoP